MLNEETIKKQKRVKPELPAGFRDYGPADAIAKQAMIDTIRTTFERFGFDPLETSSVQRTEVLTGGEEDSGKIIFNVKGSEERESDLPAGALAKEGSSLRFDLTVPLARFMAANPDLPKPFKRYQIGTVWRGERPQQGRYREFLQADVDIVGASSIDADKRIVADAEIVAVIYYTLKNLGIENFLIKLNSRIFLNEYLSEVFEIPKEKIWKVLREIDKRDKIGMEGVRKGLIKEVGSVIANNIIEMMELFFTGKNPPTPDVARLTKKLQFLGIPEKYYIFDPYMVRGLSYYTGIVFETILTDFPEIGSIFSGGRYDDLVARFTGQRIPAVGASLGIDRLFAAMEKLGTSQKKQTLTQVLILQLDAGLKNECLAMAQELRDAGINTSLYLGDDQTFQAQLAYAVKKEIPYVAIFGEQEKAKGVVAVKNLATREQEEISRDQLTNYFRK